jgi:hypothetical protein
VVFIAVGLIGLVWRHRPGRPLDEPGADDSLAADATADATAATDADTTPDEPDPAVQT